MKKSSALISTLQILKKIFSQQVIWVKAQIFGNAEFFSVVVHIKMIIKFIQKGLITSHSSRKLWKRILKSGK